jgi:hypothetical protein
MGHLGSRPFPREIPDEEVLASLALEAVAKRLDMASETDSAERPNGYENWDRPLSVLSFPFGKPRQITLM